MSQHALAQQHTQKLNGLSLQQPGRVVSRKPVGIEAGIAALVLAALCLSLALVYAVQSAVCTKNGYTAQALKRSLEDVSAQNELLRYQINLGQSNYRVEQAASRLAMHPASSGEVDYVLLPQAERSVELAELDPVQTQGGLRGVLTAFADEVVGSAAGHAEASTGTSHRP